MFSFLAPQTEHAVHDPGFNASGTSPGTLVKLDEPDLYYYVVDTKGMHGGLGWWYFCSEDDDYTKRRAKVGKFIVADVPRALIDRDARPAVGVASTQSWWQRLWGRRLIGIDVIGAS